LLAQPELQLPAQLGPMLLARLEPKWPVRLEPGLLRPGCKLPTQKPV
jgi:hypothetical protein